MERALQKQDTIQNRQNFRALHVRSLSFSRRISTSMPIRTLNVSSCIYIYILAKLPKNRVQPILSHAKAMRYCNISVCVSYLYRVVRNTFRFTLSVPPTQTTRCYRFALSYRREDIATSISFEIVTSFGEQVSSRYF